MELDKNQLIKEIKDTLEELETLRVKVAEVERKNSQLEAAQALTFHFFKLGFFPVEEFPAKFEEYKAKSLEELSTFEKAAELIQSTTLGFSIGSLSDLPGNFSNLDPLTRAIIEE
jgi:hypothetical protein